ncbi:serine/threonine-protein kinase OSR1/STK39 [Marchantia polymorpha subsp. ruderalis]|uniref:Protein kinase domain-containing protein n=1 Tax=Marchantia polymorpha TaxID=3197 RepID=A0A2R6XMN6_MARPO|nr:hypothetical protein MARPO_0008s0135 [Marchantia polymorpha]BBN19460.1 hypothetical protein Mp_8g10870 [Marchantia polymorpha subsp. ruderalis]|eukprot:PTQ47370.1 hypothetical protein MARPO_0008s0135 [Marchantia polymorpha]
MDAPKGAGAGGGDERRSYPVTAADYKILEEVGQGVSATVYRAQCTPFNETVAIKSLDLEKCISNLDEIRKEAQMMSLIAHPNVVKAYCSFVVDRSLWVVMPYMAGGSCLHIMKSAFSDGFEEPVIATVLKEVLKALDYLHRHGHIHRDVKAGNILVDSNGQVKLGDFGVSACMFDTGDRQRSRNTFVGTPCWMAPEVMEQLHGYDFKADIWSFGITALELAHGHAPFSKYPPMKVLLMTLQNAPPGLDYERDKRFSKAFKEMIAMCLVKDPAKRPSAEKLLKHSFFKHAKTFEYIARHVLDGLPPLGERVKNLKAKDAARLAQKKMPYGEQEERSQNEYKRGVSSWNFNVEDLKAQAALLDDEDATQPSSKDLAADSPRSRPKDSSSEDGRDAGSDSQSGWSLPSDTRDFLPASGPLYSPRADSGPPPERVPRARSGPLPSGAQVAKASNGGKPGPGPNLGRKDSSQRHSVGRFEVEDALDLDRAEWHDDSRVRAGEDRDQSRRSDEPDWERDGGGGGSFKSRDDGREGARGGEELPRINVFRDRERISSMSMPVMCGSGGGGSKDVPDEKLKGTFVQKKVAAIFPHLQNLLHHCVSQQELVLNLINSMTVAGDPPPPATGASRLSHMGSKSFMSSSNSLSISTSEASLDVSTEKERDLLDQVSGLQSRVASLVDELQVVKLRNVQLERQLNAIYNKEEEERIRKEEAAKEEG